MEDREAVRKLNELFKEVYDTAEGLTRRHPAGSVKDDIETVRGLALVGGAILKARENPEELEQVHQDLAGITHRLGIRVEEGKRQRKATR